MDQFEIPYHTVPYHERMSPSMPVYADNRGLPNYGVAQQHVSMLAMSNSGSRPSETKPRLAKEDVAFLERAFDANHKPTTQTKRGYAENMGVDLPRINVSNFRQ